MQAITKVTSLGVALEAAVNDTLDDFVANYRPRRTREEVLTEVIRSKHLSVNLYNNGVVAATVVVLAKRGADDSQQHFRLEPVRGGGYRRARSTLS